MLFSIAKYSHTAPAEFTVAATAVHVGTPIVFLDLYLALGAPAHISGQREAPESASLLIVALTTLVPGLVALETGSSATVGTLKLVALADLLDLFLTLKIRAPDHLRVLVNFARQAHSSQPVLLFVGEVCQHYFFRD